MMSEMFATQAASSGGRMDGSKMEGDAKLGPEANSTLTLVQPSLLGCWERGAGEKGPSSRA